MLKSEDSAKPNPGATTAKETETGIRIRKTNQTPIAAENSKTDLRISIKVKIGAQDLNAVGQGRHIRATEMIAADQGRAQLTNQINGLQFLSGFCC